MIIYMKRINKTYIKFRVVVTIFVISITFFLGMNTAPEKSNIFSAQKKFVYSGTYSLFIELENSITFNWITEKSDKGFYELFTSNNETIVKGETEVGRIHRINIDHELDEELIFKFGGINERLNEIRLKPIPKTDFFTFKNVDSLYIVGDVHGRYNQLINLLQQANIVDTDLNWIAGKSHLVFLGDLFDRGYDVTKVLWFIYSLEQKAEAVGGKIHLVLGNHEIMTISNDLRYLSPKESAIAKAYDTEYDKMFHPTKTVLGAWLSSKPSVLKVDNILLAHGGVVDLGTNSVNEFNTQAIEYIKDPLFLDIMIDDHNRNNYDQEKWEAMRHFFYDKNSPYWYRGYVYQDTLTTQLDNMLKKYKSKVHVVAHTPLKTITQRYNGKLLTTDLEDASTQLLLLVRKNKLYSRYKIDSSGEVVELN